MSTTTETASVLTPQDFASQEVYNAFIMLVTDRGRLRMLRVGMRSSNSNHSLKNIKSRCGLTSRNIDDMITEINQKIAAFHK